MSQVVKSGARVLRAAALVGLLGVVFVGCGQGNERLVEKGKLESEGDIAAQNENLARRSQALETDLTERQRLLQGVRGSFEGTLPTETGDFRIRVTLTPNLPPYLGVRVRMPEEVVADLNYISLSAQITQWRPGGTMGAIGCRAEGIRPDYLRGEITLATATCPNLYQIRLSQNAPTSQSEPEVARQFAAQLREGKLDQIEALSGEMHPSQAPSIYKYRLLRVKVSP